MDGRRLVLTFVWGASIAAGMATAAGAAVLDSLAFFGERASDADRLHTVMVASCVLGLCLLSLAAAARLRLPSTLLWICVAGSVCCAIVAYWAYGAMRVAPPEEYPDPWWTGLRDALLFPTDWPLLACLVLSPFIPPTPRERESGAVRVGASQ